MARSPSRIQTGLAWRPEAANRDGFLLPAVFQHFRAFNEDSCPWGGLVADHLRRTRAAAHRTDALAVGARCDDHAFARLEDLGGLVDGQFVLQREQVR